MYGRVLGPPTNNILVGSGHTRFMEKKYHIRRFDYFQLSFSELNYKSKSPSYYKIVRSFRNNNLQTEIHQEPTLTHNHLMNCYKLVVVGDQSHKFSEALDVKIW